MRDLKRRIIEYWVQDLSVRKIADLVGLGKTRVDEIILEYRKAEPSIDEIKEWYQLLKKKGLNPRDSPRLGVFKGKMDEMDLSTEKLPDIKYLEKYGDKASDVLDQGVKLAALEESEHKSYTQISAEYPVLAASVKSLREEKATLLKQNEGLTNKIRDQQGLLNLQNQLDLLHVNIATMNNFVAKHKKLASLGFTETSAEILGEELARKGLMPKEASETVVEAIEKYGSLDAAIATTEDTLSSLKEDVKTQEKALEEAQKLTETAKEKFGKLRDRLDQDVKDAIADEKVREEEFEKKLTAAEKGLAEINAAASQISGRMAFASAICDFAADPVHVPNALFNRIVSTFLEIKILREKGYSSLSETAEKKAKNELITGFMEIVKEDVVPKNAFDQLTLQHEKVLEEKNELEKVLPQLGNIRSDLRYAKGNEEFKDQLIVCLSEVICGRGPSHGGAVLHVCPNCRRRGVPAQGINKTNFRATLIFKCRFCEEESTPTLQTLYETTLKLTRGMDSVAGIGNPLV